MTAALAAVAACASPAGPAPGATSAPAAATPPVPAPSAPGATALVGPTWHWFRTLDPERSWEPADPTHYTLTLGADGRAAVRADCNRGTGPYTLDGSSLQLGALATTRMACPPGSLDDRYLKQLAAIRIAVPVAGMLRADLYADAGTMWFVAEPDATFGSYTCAGGRQAWVVYTQDRARLVTGPDVHDLTQAPAASGARYAAGDVVWHTKGEGGFLERGGQRTLADCIANPKA